MRNTDSKLSLSYKPYHINCINHWKSQTCIVSPANRRQSHQSNLCCKPNKIVNLNALHCIGIVVHEHRPTQWVLVFKSGAQCTNVLLILINMLIRINNSLVYTLWVRWLRLTQIEVLRYCRNDCKTALYSFCSHCRQSYYSKVIVNHFYILSRLPVASQSHF